jgi:hypothetical protein
MDNIWLFGILFPVLLSCTKTNLATLSLTCESHNEPLKTDMAAWLRRVASDYGPGDQRFEFRQAVHRVFGELYNEICTLIYIVSARLEVK